MVKSKNNKIMCIRKSIKLKQDIFSIDISKNKKAATYLSKQLDISQNVLINFFGKNGLFLSDEKVISSDKPCERKAVKEECTGYVVAVFGRLSGPRWTSTGFISYFSPVWKKYNKVVYCIDTGEILSKETKIKYSGLFVITWLSDSLQDMKTEEQIAEPLLKEILRKFVYYYGVRLRWITCEQWDAASKQINKNNYIEEA